MLFPGLVTMVGLILLLCGSRLPEYSVPNGKELLFSPSWQVKELASEATGDVGQLEQQWYALRDKIVTRRFVYCDLGWSLSALGISVALIFGLNHVWTLKDLREMKTPSSKKLLYALAAIIWLAYIPANLFWIDFVDSRDDAPFVENMAVPIDSTLTVAFGLIGLPIILLGVWLSTRQRSLAAPMWSSSTSASPTTLALWFALILAFLVTVAGVVSEPPLVPCGICTVHLLLCGRAISVLPRQTVSRCGFEVVQ